MEKKAVLVKGGPIIIDNIEEFKVNTKRNLDLIAEIAVTEGYDLQYASLEKMIKTINESSDSDNFLFYFTGHANKDYMGTLDYKTNDVLEAMKSIKGEKIIILDACIGNYEGGQDFEALNLPRNSTIISAKEIYDNKSLAKLLYDAVILRKNKLKDVDKNTFDEMKHNWVYFMKNK